MKCGQSNQENKSMVVTGQLTKKDMMKIFMSIDRELIREAQRTEKTPTNLSELDQVVTELLRADFAENEISALATGSKTIVFPGEVTQEVRKKVSQVVQACAMAAEGVTKFPDRASVETILSSIKGPVAKFFIYGFIPSDSNLLVENPDVKRKRNTQLELLSDMAKGISFPVDYLKKHVRNAIVEFYKTNPEQVLHDIANGKDRELSGLGDINWTTIASAASNVVSTVTSLFKKESAPVPTDYSKQMPPSQPQVVVIPPQQNVTRDPAYEKEKDNTALYVGLAIAGLGVAGVAGYVMTH